jgi:hypothetical protein
MIVCAQVAAVGALWNASLALILLGAVLMLTT